MVHSSTNVSASSSNDGSRRRRDPRSFVAGIPDKCWCKSKIVEKISGSEDNPCRRYYRCGFAYEEKLRDDGHVFKWVDEAYRNEIQQLDYQVEQLEKEVALLKSGQSFETMFNRFESEVFQHAEEMMASAKREMRKMMALVVGASLLIVVVGLALKN